MRSRSQLVLEDLLFQYLESHGRRMEKYYLGFQAMVEQDVVEAMERIWLQMRDPSLSRTSMAISFHEVWKHQGSITDETLQGVKRKQRQWPWKAKIGYVVLRP
jgi:hypothetical protein